MGIAWNSLLLCAPYIRTPTKGVVAPRLDPVVDELEVVFSFFQGTVALIHSQRISEIETSVAVDVKRRHAAGFCGAEIQTGESGVGGRGRPHSIGLHTNAVTIESETEIGDQEIRRASCRERV